MIIELFVGSVVLLAVALYLRAQHIKQLADDEVEDEIQSET